jgi:hypothetical protein
LATLFQILNFSLLFCAIFDGLGQEILASHATQDSMQLALHDAEKPRYLFLKGVPDAELVYGNSSLVQQIFW